MLTLTTHSARSYAADIPMQFGMDFAALGSARAHGLSLPFGTLWVGSWIQRYGWNTPRQTLTAAAAGNITPVINWWYWGDDITPQCVENGCQDVRQGVWKDKASWYRMTSELASLVESTMGNRLTVVILETEFNKNGIETYEPFDGYLADTIALLHARGNIKVVLGFGNWGLSNWARFDRAAAAADLIGMQLMRSSVRDASTYLSAVSTLIASAQHAQNTFRRLSVVTDLALSSYPNYEGAQAQVLADLFARLPELKNAGVRGVFYRMLTDDPRFDTSNYHGEAERYWGLLRADGSEKPAYSVFAEGVGRETGSGTPTCTAPGAPQSFGFTLQGRIVTLAWNANTTGGPATGYVIEAGSGPGLANLVVAPIGARLVQVSAPPGTYYVRVRAQNACGAGAPTADQIIRVP